jgi:hypothetical protein
VRSTIRFTAGSPPFILHYTVAQTAPISRSQSLHHQFLGSKGELIIDSLGPGEFQYTFDSIEDANYQKVPLRGMSRTQTIHPISNARWMSDDLFFRSCQGESTINVEIELTVRSKIVLVLVTHDCVLIFRLV